MTRRINRLHLGLLAAAATALALATTALGGSGVGGVFNLGQANPVDATTILTGTTAGPQLQVTNASTAASIFSIYGLVDTTTPGGGSTAVRGHNKGTGTAGYGVYGSHAGEGIGVYGTTATGAGIGVLGRHFGSTGSGPGVKGVNSSSAGAGVLGTNVGGGPGLSAVVNSGVAPLSVNSSTKVPNLNADKLDGSDASDFLHNSVPLSLTGSTSTDGVITGTNTGSANGVQGETSASGASGVYGQNSGIAGYGVAGRSNTLGGVGVYAEALGGGGRALVLHTNGTAPPMKVDSSARVANLNADKVDGVDASQLVVGDPGRGGRLLANRLTGAGPGDILLNIPTMGVLVVHTCDGDKARVLFDTAGTGNVDLMYSGIFSNGFGAEGDIDPSITTSEDIPLLNPVRMAGFTVNIARDTGAQTKIATIWVSWYAVGCRFQAQAVLTPQL